MRPRIDTVGGKLLNNMYKVFFTNNFGGNRVGVEEKPVCLYFSQRTLENFFCGGVKEKRHHFILFLVLFYFYLYVGTPHLTVCKGPI